MDGKHSKKQGGEKRLARRDTQVQKKPVTQQNHGGTENQIQEVEKPGRATAQSPKQAPDTLRQRPIKGQARPIRPITVRPDFKKSGERVQSLVLHDEWQVIVEKGSSERCEVGQQKRQDQPKCGVAWRWWIGRRRRWAGPGLGSFVPVCPGPVI